MVVQTYPCVAALPAAPQTLQDCCAAAGSGWAADVGCCAHCTWGGGGSRQLPCAATGRLEGAADGAGAPHTFALQGGGSGEWLTSAVADLAGEQESAIAGVAA